MDEVSLCQTQTCLISQRLTLVGGLGFQELEEEPLLAPASRLAFVAGSFAAAAGAALARLLG